MQFSKEESFKTKLYKIFENRNGDSLLDFDFKEFDKNNELVDNDYINSLILIMAEKSFNKKNGYKDTNNFIFFNCIFKLMEKYNLVIKGMINKHRIFESLTIMNKGQHFLYNLRYLIDKNNTEDHPMILDTSLNLS